MSKQFDLKYSKKVELLYYPQDQSTTDFQMSMLEKDLPFTPILIFPCGIAQLVRGSLKPLSLTRSDL